MSKYYIFACDQMYGGLHGMYDIAVRECRSIEEAEEIATEMSYGVIDAFDNIDGLLAEDAEEAVNNGDYEDFDSAYEDYRESDVEFSVFQIKPEFSGYSVEDLDVLANNDYEFFEETYCIR